MSRKVQFGHLDAIEVPFAIIDLERPILYLFIFLRLLNGYVRRHALICSVTRLYLRFDCEYCIISVKSSIC